MPRRQTPFIQDTCYHLFNRGNNRQKIFFTADNYQYFLNGVRKYLRPQAAILAFCLMPTHYHLLARVNSPSSENSAASQVSLQMSRAMQRLLISYTKAVNQRFGRIGALFQGQFQAKPVRRYQHLLRLCLYIHSNPVKDGLVVSPAEWPFSNYLEWIGERNEDLFDPAFARDHFGTPAEYKAMVADYRASRSRLPK